MRSQRRGNKAKDRRPSVLGLLGTLIVVTLGARILYAYEVSPMAPGDTAPVRITIPRGAGAVQIASLLVDRGLSRNVYANLLSMVLTGRNRGLKAGSYELTRSMSVRKMIEMIDEGKTQTFEVIVPEGFTAAQIADRLASNQLVKRNEFLFIVYQGGQGFEFPDGFALPKDLEGYLYPLSYNITRGTAARQIVDRMVGAFDDNVVQTHPQVHDWHKIVIIASLIEREAKVDGDRPLIASVYYNRLKKGMPLQCDATVQYALPQHKVRLFYSDLKVPSAYNTYLHRGLPPGPICNPGLLSIEAAINPSPTDYLFYVAGPGGKHLFSRTLAEQDAEIRTIRSME